jgi:L-ascorbate metabolism protein UlaG (beta-lactamase superfamily)
MIQIKWFGHSFFQIMSSGGTKIITDPFGPMGFPVPEVWPDVVTIGREQGNHNNVGLAKGNPVILQGLKQGTTEWQQIDTTFRDVRIYNVPIDQRGFPGYEGSPSGFAFVFEMDGLRICYSGDMSGLFKDDQLNLIGQVDILLQTIGGGDTIRAEVAKKIVEQLRPRIVIPIHYWCDRDVFESFIEGPYSVHSLNTNTLTVSRDTLPPSTEIIIPKIIREHDL